MIHWHQKEIVKFDKKKTAISFVITAVSATSWWSVLLVEETGVPRENQWPAVSHRQTLSHNVVSSIPRQERNSNSQPDDRH